MLKPLCELTKCYKKTYQLKKFVAQGRYITNVTGGNFVAGQVSRAGTETYTAVSPIGQDSLPGLFHNATEGEITAAVEAASVAFPAYREISCRDRGEFLRTIGQEIELLGEELIERAHLETGLPLPRLRNERARTVDQLHKFAVLVEEGSWVNAKVSVGGGVNIRRLEVPIGPVTVFGASNFPLAFSVAGGDAAAALAAGCPIVVKAHPSHPGTSDLVAVAIQRAIKRVEQVPEGTFSMLHGTTPEICGDIVTRPEIKAVGFTGSHTAGRALFDLCAQRPQPIPVFAEMGSINPVVLLPDALEQRLDTIVNGLAGSMTLGAGQFCTQPGIAFVIDQDKNSSIFPKFVDALVRAVEVIPAQTMLTPSILRVFNEQIATLETAPGVKTLTSNRSTDAKNTEVAGVIQVVDAQDFLVNTQMLSEEIFGPFTLIVKCKSNAELTKALEALEGQLTATVWGLSEGDGEVLNILAEKAGRVICNGWPTGVEVCSAMNHGGPYPASSIDATSVGTEAIHRFTRPVCYQDVPSQHLPNALQDMNPDCILRNINGVVTRDQIDGSSYTHL